MRRRVRDEDGVTLAITLSVLVALLLMAAVVVDIGAVYAARRHDQSSVDAAAIGGAHELGDDAAVAAQVKALVHRNLGETLTAAQWDSCTPDPERLEILAPGARCISFNRSRSRVRVRLPDQFVTTGFSSVIGIDRIRHSAFAVAAVTQRGFGGVLPFGMPAGAGAGDGYVCVKTNSGGQSAGPCNGPDSGNFGTLDLAQFGNEDVGTTQSCGSGQTRDRMANNIAVGADHVLEVAGTDPTKVDTQLCSSLTPGPNAAMTQTGNNQGPVGSGLFSGMVFSDGGPARLQRRDASLLAGAGRVRLVHGRWVDDNPLWSFIPSELRSGPATGGQVPVSCQRDQFVDVNGVPTTAALPTVVRSHVSGLSLADRMVALLQRCMTHYRGQPWSGGAEMGLPALSPPEPRQGCAGPASTAPCTDPVFGLDSSRTDSPDLFDIQYTPRFGYVPEMEGPFPAGASQAVRFRSFSPVFIQRLVIGNGAGATSYDPGVGSPPTSPVETDVREVTVWAFPTGMLPGRLDEDRAPYAIGVNRFVQLVR